MILLLADFALRSLILILMGVTGAQNFEPPWSLRLVGFDPLGAVLEPAKVFPFIQFIFGCFIKMPALWCKIEIFAVYLSLECHDSGCASVHQVIATVTQAIAIALAALSLALMIMDVLQSAVQEPDAQGLQGFQRGGLFKAWCKILREGPVYGAIAYSVAVGMLLFLVVCCIVQFLNLWGVFYCDSRNLSVVRGCEPVRIHPNCSCALSHDGDRDDLGDNASFS